MQRAASGMHRENSLPLQLKKGNIVGVLRLRRTIRFANHPAALRMTKSKSMSDFLLEIGCEEIPARMIDAASRELRERLQTLLQRERLEPTGTISHLDSPRRLAVLASGIPTSQPDITEQVSGPSAQVAYKDGQPTPAAHAFAKKVGVDVSNLQKVSTPKGEYLSATVTRKGRPAAEILAETLPKEISTLYWPKNMYWRKRGEVFVRPVRWLVAMLDEQVVPLELFGIVAGKTSRGAPHYRQRVGRDFEAQCLCRYAARSESSWRLRA